MDLFRVYKEYCEDNKLKCGSRFLFKRVIDDLNIGIFHPRKEQCDTCTAYKANLISEEIYTCHIKNKELAQKQKADDKEESYKGNCHVITMDLQAVKLAPSLRASALYYKTKLLVHNFTVYDLKTKSAVCYWWDEIEGDLSASVFASCITDFINNKYLDDLPIIIYSDGCCYQNRNAMMSNALLDLAMKQNRTIYQKFLEKGHTYMECDSVYSAIETQLKHEIIYLPTDYVRISKKARSANPYEVKTLDHTFFKDYSLKKYQRYSSIRPGAKKGDPVVTNLKNLKYSPDGKLYYKLAYNKEDWTLLNNFKELDNVNYPNLFQNKIKISSRKYKDLQDIKLVIPQQYHSFYDELSCNN